MLDALGGPTRLRLQFRQPPNGWRDRVVHRSNNSTGHAHAAFLEPHDCVVYKLVAHRDKDRAFAQALLHARLDISTLRSVRTEILRGQYEAGEDTRDIAEMFRLDIHDVLATLRHEDKLRPLHIA